MGAKRKTRRGGMIVEKQERFVRLIAQGVSNSIGVSDGGDEPARHVGSITRFPRPAASSTGLAHQFPAWRSHTRETIGPLR